MIPTLLAGLASLALSPAALQAALLQQPAVQPKVEALAKTNDIRLVQRQTTDAASLQLQPPPGMSYIPGGQVFVGTDVTKIADVAANDATRMREVLAETPRHSVTIPSFFIDTTEVTNLQWKVFLDATGRKPTAVLVANGWPVTEKNPEGIYPAGQEYYPIANVNIPELRDYLVWCGKRLPTEEEWTRAARGDDDRAWPWGSNWDPKLCQSGATIPSSVIEVGKYPGGASPYGVLDMTGNVAEWVDSPFSAFESFEPYPFKQGKKSITLSPDFNSTYKVFKGGCYINTRMDTRIDSRFGMAGAGSDAGLGFRAARSLQPGLESVRHGKKRLLPPQFARTDVDEKDMFGKEILYYDDARRVITGYHFLAFAHRGPERGKPVSGIRKDSIDEPFPLGVLVTSEPMILSDMRDTKTHKPVAIPAGEYTLCFKSQGESKEYKRKKASHKDADDKAKEKEEKEKADKDKAAKDAKKPAGKDKADDKAKAEPEPSASDLGAAVPWPGVGSIHDIAEDIDFPQDEDVILYFNAANVVVAWQKVAGLNEVDVSPVVATPSESGKLWTIEFSIDQVTGKSPRFKLPIRLGGTGLP